MQNLQQTDEDYYVTTTQILNLARKVGPLFKSSEVDTKRQILNTVLQNCEANDATLVPTYRKPFDLLAKGLSRSNWLPVLDEFRNWLMYNSVSPLYKELLSALKTG